MLFPMIIVVRRRELDLSPFQIFTKLYIYVHISKIPIKPAAFKDKAVVYLAKFLKSTTAGAAWVAYIFTYLHLR